MGERCESFGDEQLGSHGDRGDLAEFGKNASQIKILLPHHMWAENNNIDENSQMKN